MAQLTASRVLRVHVTDDESIALVGLNGEVVTTVLSAEQITREVEALGIVIDAAGVENIAHFARVMAEGRLPGPAVVALAVAPEGNRDGVNVYGKPLRLSQEGGSSWGATLELDDDRIVAGGPGPLDVVGEVDSTGEIVVNGSVLDGARVRSESSIVVHGAIRGAEVQAGADLYAAGGMVGKGKGVLSAGNDIHSKYICKAEVQAGGDVNVIGDVFDCDLRCQGRITVEQGALAGGRAVACGGAELMDLGSEAGVETYLEVGVDEELERRFNELAAAIENGQGELIEELQRVYEAGQERAVTEVTIDGTVYAGVTICFGQVRATVGKTISGPLRIFPEETEGTVRMIAINGETGTSYDLKGQVDKPEFWQGLEKLVRPVK